MTTYSSPYGPFPQPVAGMARRQQLDGTHETVDYLPGTTVRIWYTYLDTCYPLHCHRALEIISGERGFYRLTINGVPCEVHPDNILLIPGGILHTLEPHDCNGFVHLLSLDPLRKIRSMVRVNSMLDHPIMIRKEDDPILYASANAALEQMREQYFSKNDLRELNVYASLIVLLERVAHHDLAQNAQAATARYDKKRQYAEMFNQVLLYMEAHYREDLRMDAVAQRFGLSKYHFIRLFKQYTQHTFCGYLTFRRMQEAERLMSASPTLSITEIARYAGFSSVSTFSRQFAQLKKCPPSQYRQLYIREQE